jgi:ribosomal protein L16 Arg81 hydroxylase
MHPTLPTARVPARWTLAELIAPFQLAQFAHESYGRAPLVVEGPADKFADLFSWPELNRVLAALAFHGAADALLAVQGRDKVAPRSLEHLQTLCREGHTLVINALERHHEVVRRLALAVQNDTGERVGCNVYVSRKGVPGAVRHYDDHDVLVLQLEGSKQWRLWDATRAAPTYSLRRLAGVGPQPGGVVREVRLARGDLLYLPRGWWHEALARDEDSLHLTVGIYPRTGRELVTWLLDLLEQQEPFRASRPLAALEQDAAGAPAGFRAWLADIVDVLVLAGRSPEVASLYHRHCLMQRQPPSLPSFPLPRPPGS